FPQGQTDRQQTAPPSDPHGPDSPAQAPRQQRTALPLPQPELAATHRQEHTRGCSRSDDQSECCQNPHVSKQRSSTSCLPTDHKDCRHVAPEYVDTTAELCWLEVVLQQR